MFLGCRCPAVVPPFRWSSREPCCFQSSHLGHFWKSVIVHYIHMISPFPSSFPYPSYYVLNLTVLSYVLIPPPIAYCISCDNTQCFHLCCSQDALSCLGFRSDFCPVIIGLTQVSYILSFLLMLMYLFLQMMFLRYPKIIAALFGLLPLLLDFYYS